MCPWEFPDSKGNSLASKFRKSKNSFDPKNKSNFASKFYKSGEKLEIQLRRKVQWKWRQMLISLPIWSCRRKTASKYSKTHSTSASRSRHKMDPGESPLHATLDLTLSKTSNTQIVEKENENLENALPAIPFVFFLLSVRLWASRPGICFWVAFARQFSCFSRDVFLHVFVSKVFLPRFEHMETVWNISNDSNVKQS